MGKGNKGIPLHEAGEVLRRIELDTSTEAAALPVADAGEQALSAADAERRVLETQESYEELRRLYLKGELSAQELKDVFVAAKGNAYFNIFESVSTGPGKSKPATKVNEYVGPDEMAVQRLLREIEDDAMPHPPTLVWRKSEGDIHAVKPEGERWADNPEQAAFLELCQEYAKGMPTAEIRRQFVVDGKDRVRRRAAIDFFKKLKDGLNPSAYLMNEVLLSQPGFKEKGLEQQDWQGASQKLLKATREVWGPFVYSGKWKNGKVDASADLDAKVSLLLLRLAGIQSAARDKVTAVPPGEHKAGATTLDSGLRSGVTAEHGGTIIIDNHQRGRGYETSSAKILYNLLRSSGMIREQGPLRALVELSVADDNARLITNLEQFTKSSRTLRGLHRTLSESQLLKFYERNWGRAAVELRRSRKLKRDDELPGESMANYILDYELSDGEIKEWNLRKAQKEQQATIEQAKVWFQKQVGEGTNATWVNKSDAELEAEGHLVVTGEGDKKQRWVVNIMGAESKLRGGHDAVKAYGFDGLLSFNPSGKSFSVNALRHNIDLNEIMAGFEQGVPVRGAMWIKPRDGRELNVGLADIIKRLAPDYEPKGVVKHYLEHGLDKPWAGLEKNIESGSAAADDAEPATPSEEIEKEVRSIISGDIKLSGEPIEVASDSGAQPVANEAAPAKPDSEIVLPKPAEEVSAQSEQPAPPTNLPVVEERAPDQKVVERAPESWSDDTGVKFSRELTMEEQKVKDEIDNVFRINLEAKTRGRIKELNTSGEDLHGFINGFVERGMRHGSIIASRKRLYNEKGLPLAE